MKQAHRHLERQYWYAAIPEELTVLDGPFRELFPSMTSKVTLASKVAVLGVSQLTLGYD